MLLSTVYSYDKLKLSSIVFFFEELSFIIFILYLLRLFISMKTE